MTGALAPLPLARLLVARRVPQAVAERARREFNAVLAERDMDAEEVLRAVVGHGVQAVFSGPKVRLAAAHVAALPDAVRIIANPSAGTDHMDVAAARARGIAVTNTPDVLTDCTADLAFMLILNACRRGAEYEAVMRRGWQERYGMPDMLGMRPSGRTLGIVGMGRIGQAVAKRAASTCGSSTTTAAACRPSRRTAPNTRPISAPCCRAATSCPCTCPAARTPAR